MTKLINFLKWFFAFAVFGVAVYAIYEGWQYLKAKGSAVADALKPSAYKKKGAKQQTTFEKYFPNIAEIKDKSIDYFKENPINPIVPIVTDIIDKVKEPVNVSPVSDYTNPSKFDAVPANDFKVAKDKVIVPEEKTIFQSVVDFFKPVKEETHSSPGEIKNSKTLADLSGVVGKQASVKIAPMVLKKTLAVSTAFKQVSKSMR